MLTLRDHNVEDYATLSDIDAGDVAVLDEADRACLDELGHHLVSTDAWRRFAIWLLHKHFEPDRGEVFIESVITAPRGTQTTLVDRRSAPGLKPTSIRFDPDISSGVGVIGMEFADPADFGSTPSVNPNDEAVLSGVAQRLRAHGKIERFGVRLIRNPLGLSKNDVLVETCDIANQTLRCGVLDRDGLGANSVETSWRWTPSPGQTGPTPKPWCEINCWTDEEGNHWRWNHLNIPD